MNDTGSAVATRLIAARDGVAHAATTEAASNASCPATAEAASNASCAATTQTAQEAAKVLRAGGLVAFPTETVYGLGADATNGQAVARLYAAKGRPSFNPLIAHVADMQSAMALAQFNPDAERLAAAFWPGPLTLVLPKAPGCTVSELATAGLDSIALRMPDHPVARAILLAFGKPVVAPSANRSGHVSPTTAQHVMADLAGRVDLVVDGGPTRVGVESTIVACLGTPVLLRPGGVAREALEKVLQRLLSPVGTPSNAGAAQGATVKSAGTAPATSQPVSSHSTSGDRATARKPAPPDAPNTSGDASRDSVLAPGMLASHYAPHAMIQLGAKKVEAGDALLAFGPVPCPGADQARMVLNLSERGDVIEAAANLFSHLRTLDASGAPRIAVMEIPHEGLGEAINDRLRRAAAPR